MPNYKQRMKKDGRNKSKKKRAMRLSVEHRRANRQGPERRGRFKKGLPDQPIFKNSSQVRPTISTVARRPELGRNVLNILAKMEHTVDESVSESVH